MAYTKTVWVSRQCDYPRRFNKSQETETLVTLTPNPGGVTVPGTPFSPENMNNIEEGIAAAHEGITAIQEAVHEELTAVQAAVQDELTTVQAAVQDEVAAVQEGIAAVQEAVAAVQEAALNSFFPIGMIYMSVENVNPATFVGGTWTVWGKGRVPVGVDTSQPEFDTVEKTNGAKTHTLSQAEMPSHTHTQNAHGHGYANSIGRFRAHGDTRQFGYRTGNGQAWANGAFELLPAGDSISCGYNASGAATSYSDLCFNLANGGFGIASNTATNQNTGGGAAHNNLQPYITCYMWKRTG